MERRVIILGSTGSIGTQAVECVEHLNRLAAGGGGGARYRVVGLAAGRNGVLLAEQARRLGVGAVALTDGAGELPADGLPIGARVFRGPAAAEELVRGVACDVVLAAIVGVAGLGATLAAAELGRDVALANKETLVAAGCLVAPAAWRGGGRVLPVDSEHSALWQCLEGVVGGGPGLAPPMRLPESVSRLVLTASGGALRGMPLDRLRDATPAEALKHPTWSMGPKVTVDSASLMNKALELIEAHWLFGAPAERLAAVVHPQSIVHGLVELEDGSVLAHLAAADMRLPIQHALTWPARAPGCGRRLDVLALSGLSFERVDERRWPAIGLAYAAIRAGGTAGATLNAANEQAVELFLRPGSGVRFGWISDVVADVVGRVRPEPLHSLEQLAAVDAEARRLVRAAAGM